MRKILLSACVAVVASLGFLVQSAPAQLIKSGVSLNIGQTILCDAKAPLEEILNASKRNYGDGILVFRLWNRQPNDRGEPLCAYMGPVVRYSIGEIDATIYTLSYPDDSIQLMRIVRVAYQRPGGYATGYLLVLSHMTEKPKVPI